jgi:hypothetical protein
MLRSNPSGRLSSWTGGRQLTPVPWMFFIESRPMPGNADPPLARHSRRQRSNSFALRLCFRATSPVAELGSKARIVAIFRSRPQDSSGQIHSSSPSRYLFP